ncbi:MAG: hypothetical protein ACK5M3_02320 [Dysgonomonas sp.]
MRKSILVIPLCILCSCYQNKNNKTLAESNKLDVNKNTSPSEIVQISDLIPLLGKTIDSLPNFGLYKKQQITIEGDEGEEWNGINYLDENQIAFLIESNWENKKTVYRITIFSNKIKDGNLQVGQRISNIKSILDPNIPSSPDGYLFVKMKAKSEISAQLDISNISDKDPLYYGVKNISNIPDSLKIESIVIMK